MLTRRNTEFGPFLVLRHRHDVEEPFLLHAVVDVLRPLQRRPPRQELEGDAAEEENIAARIAGRGAGGPFEAGVVDGAVDLDLVVARTGLVHVAVDDVGEAEVHQLGRAEARHEHVRRLHVAVGDALGERIGEPGRRLLEDLQGLVRLQLLAATHPLAEVASLDELHHHVVLLGSCPD